MRHSPNSPDTTLERMSCAELVRVITLQNAISDAERVGNRYFAEGLRIELAKLLPTQSFTHPAIESWQICS